MNDAPSLARHEIPILLWTTFATFVALYGPQPLLPAIQQDLGVSRQAAGLLMTLAILPLGLAPVCYGYILNNCSTRGLLLAAVALCALPLAAGALCDAYAPLLLCRSLAGLLIPAILLGLMTHIAVHCEGERVQRALAVYATTTMFGAFLGRIVSGFAADFLGWRGVLLGHGLLLASALPFLFLLRRSVAARHEVPSPAQLLAVLRQPGLLSLMLIGPLCIFAHASVLNLAPFRLHELAPDIGQWGMGLLYAPAFICSLLGVFSPRIMRLLHGEMHSIRLGVILFLLFTPVLLLARPAALYVAVLGITAGFVLVYTTLPGVVNRFSRAEKHMTNAVYLTIYYTCSALGTWLPVLLYSRYGILWHVLCLVVVFILAFVLTQRRLALNFQDTP